MKRPLQTEHRRTMRNRLVGAMALAGLSVLSLADPPEYNPLPEAARPFNPPESRRALLKTSSGPRETEYQIGFDTRAVDIKEYVKRDTALGVDSIQLWQTHYAELSDYLEDALAAGRRDVMRRELVGHARFSDSAKQDNRYELPVKIPEWARRLGLAKPALSLSGTYTMQLTANSNWTNLQERAGNANKFPDFSPEQIPNISLTGNIGKFVSMTLTWNQDGFGASQSQALHIRYAGEKPEDTEDDILQEAEFGEIQLALPGTSLTGYSEAASGLVGLKARMRFGDVDLTVVGGSEQGQTQKQKIGRVARDVTSPAINDRDMDIGRDFFPSYDHRRKWIAFNGNATALKSTPTNLRVFTRIKDQDKISRPDWKPFYRGKAFARDSTMAKKYETPDGYWRELWSDKGDWTWDQGVLRLKSGVAGSAVAVAWVDGATQYGGVSGTSKVTDLVLLADDDRQNDPDLRPLQLRNRYYRLGFVAEADRPNMKIRVIDNSSKGSEKSLDSTGVEWAKVFGLVDRETGKVKYDDARVFDWGNRAILFPELEPFRKFGRGMLYDTSRTLLPQVTPRFAIEITSKTSSDSIKIGSRDMASVSGSNCVDIIEGSEVLTLNGSTRLERGRDYDVQYQTGTITLLSDRAREASADIQVDFSCRPFFSLETRTVFGGRLEYQMPWIGKESVLGGTFLYRSESVTDPRPQLQREPNQAMLWGANLRLAGESEALTDLTSRIPLVRVKSESKWRLELEGAQSWNNPNTEGYALVDDFESARQDNDLPIYSQSWYQASPPGGIPADGPGNYEDSLDYRHKGEFVWSSNSSELMRNIYPDFDDGDAAPQRTTILQLKLRPNELTGAGLSWGGIMRAFPSSWRDNSSARYLEVVTNGSGGELSFDFGQISEDLSIAGAEPNGEPDGENIDSTGASTGTPKNDFGLDGRDSKNESSIRWNCYGRNCVDQVVSSADSASEVNDPVGDDFKADLTNNDPSVQVNGTEGNNSYVDGGTNTWYDAEDIDRNSSLDRTNSFNRYTIRLGGRNASSYQKLTGGWRLYRIPLEEITLKKGAGADWSALRFARVFFHGLSTRNGANLFEQRVQIARMSLVGNQWKSVGRMTRNDSPYVVDSTATDDWTSTSRILVQDSARLSASVINSQDDNSVYRSWGVPNSEDASSGAKLREQSLRLVYKNLHRNYVGAQAGTKIDSGTALRLFENPRDFTLYRNLQLLLYHQLAGAYSDLDKTPVRVGIQFGSNVADMADAPYYEYSFNPLPATCPLKAACGQGMDESQQVETMRKSWRDNQIDIPLSALTGLKTRRKNEGKSDDSLYAEEYALGRVFGDDRKDSIVIKGQPTLSAIRWMRIWIRPNASTSAEPASGEIWVNDLKLDAPYDGIGTALRGSAQVNFSDLLDLSASTDYQGGDFVPMGQKRPELSNQKSSAHASGTAALNLERFLPEAWQARLPVNYTVTAGIDRPWARPSSDQALTRDGLTDIAADWWNGDMRRDSTDIAVANSKAYQTMNVSRTLSASWSRGRDEGSGLKPFLVNALFSRPKLSWTWNEQGTLSYARRDTTTSHSIRFDYDFSPAPPPQLRPFGGSTSKWVPSLIQNLTIQPWPTTIGATLGDLDYLDGVHSVLAEDKDSLKTRTLERKAGLNHALNAEWQLLDFLRFSGNVRSNRSWTEYQEAHRFDPKTGFVDAWPLIFDWDTTRVRIPGAEGDGRTAQEFGFLRNENGRQVGFNMDFSPRILPWFTTSGSFQASTSASREAPTTVVTGTVGTMDSTSLQFWRHDHSDNFRGNVRLDVPAVFRTLQSLGPQSWGKPLDKARQILDKWRWTGIGFDYSVDNRTAGVRQTLDYTSYREGLDAYSLWGWQTGLGDGSGLRSPLDWVTGSRSKSAFGQYDPSRLDDPRRYPGVTDTLPSESGADRSSQVNTRSYRFSGNSEVTVPGVLLRVEPSLTYLISWDERWKEPWSVDTSITWPQVSVNTSLPNFAKRVPFLKGWLESMTANNTATWERTQKLYPHRQTSNSDNKTLRFAPLVGIQAKTKGNWSFDNRFNTAYTRSLLKTKVALKDNGICPESMGLPRFYSDTTILLARCFELKGNSEDRSWEMSNEGTATYRVQTRKGIQILKWFVKLDNDLVVTFRGGWIRKWNDHDEVDASSGDAAATQRMKDVTTVYGGSNASYNFTSKLVAQFDAKYQQTASKSLTDLQGETVNHDISILASLQYRF